MIFNNPYQSLESQGHTSEDNHPDVCRYLDALGNVQHRNEDDKAGAKIYEEQVFGQSSLDLTSLSEDQYNSVVHRYRTTGQL